MVKRYLILLVDLELVLGLFVLSLFGIFRDDWWDHSYQAGRLYSYVLICFPFSFLQREEILFMLLQLSGLQLRRKVLASAI